MILGIDASRANRPNKTGVEWYGFHIIEALKKQDDALAACGFTHIVLYSEAPLAGALAKLPEGWESRVLSWPPKRLWTHLRFAWEILRRPPDVLFVPSHVPPLYHPKKTVMTVHDIAAHAHPQAFNIFERWYSMWGAKQAVRRLWKIAAPSAFVKQELLAQFAHTTSGSKAMDARIAVIPHGYDEEYAQKKSEEEIFAVLKQYDISRPFFLMLGRLEEKKNTLRLIGAFEQLRRDASLSEYQLVLAGGPGHGFERIRNAIDASPCARDIRVLGWVPQEDAYALMQAAHVFVFPPIAEGFGMPLLEAFAAGTPVVAAKSGSIPEIAGNAALFIDSFSETSLADGMRRAASEAGVRERLVQNGASRLAHFSWEQSAKRLIRLFCG